MSRLSHSSPATPSPPPRPAVVCFGEALWDVLPRGLFLGGAPLNVAYHLSRQGVAAAIVTAVGRDFLGDEVRRRVAAWDLEWAGVGRSRRPTGVVRARLDAQGIATYQIIRHVAWDAIPWPGPRARRPAPAALVFGTLALRERPNRRILERLLAAWPNSLRVLDLNLRAPFDGPEVIAYALRHAQIVKLNDTELARLAGRESLSVTALPPAARRLAADHGLTHVCVTAGARGAGLWWEGAWYWESGRTVKVRDTVGAGDAFLGALLGALLVRGTDPRAALAAACRVGEFVAARDGATPAYTIDRQGRPHDDPPARRRTRSG
jgi:fructokinase